MHLKTKLTNDKIKGVIYTIPCGETGQNSKESLYEHKITVENGHLNNAIAVHNNDTHSIRWIEAETVEHA